MKYRLITTNSIGRDIVEYSTKEDFLKELSRLIDNVKCSNGSYFDTYVYSDGNIYTSANVAEISNTPNHSLNNIIQMEGNKYGL